MSASALYASLIHVQGVLATAGRFKEAFPVLAVLEHVRTVLHVPNCCRESLNALDEIIGLAKTKAEGSDVNLATDDVCENR